jgi:uncharacterized membrane protein YcaP (DUF421 family)
MDLLRILVRVVFGFVVALALVRASGRRSIKQADVSSFIVALVIGDLFDDLFWAEIPAAQFAVAIGTLVAVHLAAATNLFSSGARQWRRAALRSHS